MRVFLFVAAMFCFGVAIGSSIYGEGKHSFLWITIGNVFNLGQLLRNYYDKTPN